jgi:hypothetical protein
MVRLVVIVVLLCPLIVCSQVRVKEERELVYTIFQNKHGFEKKRFKNFTDNVRKYDSLGRLKEIIAYGEVTHVYTSNSVGCAWNYNNISLVTKFYYSEKQLVSDSSFTYKDNKPVELASVTKYSYQDSLLVSKSQYNGENKLKSEKGYTYDNVSNVVVEMEIEYQMYGSGAEVDTTITTYVYDSYDRLLKEITKTKHFSWKREYQYDDIEKVKRKYYFSNTKDEYPDIVDVIKLNANQQPEKIESVGFNRNSVTHSTTEIQYNEHGLISSKEESYDYNRCDVEEPKAITVYEYDYY